MFESGHFLTIPQIIGAVRRRWFPASLLAFLITVGAAVALFMIRNKYESEGSIYLKAGRATLTVDPTASTSQTSSLLDTRQAEIQSIKEMLGSRYLIERVAEKVGIDRIIDQRSDLSKWLDQFGDVKVALLGKKKIEALSEEQVIELERLETCVEYIQKQMKIKASKEGNTVSISCRAHTPFLAHDIVEALMAQFNEQYVKVHKVKGSLSFFEDELAKSSEILSSRERALRDIKNQLNMMTVEDKRSLIQQELSAIQQEMIASNSALIATVAEIEHMETKLSEQPAFISQETTDKPSYASDLMRQNLYALEVTENELRAKYQDTHPQVIQVRDKIQKSREIFEKHGERTGESKKMANPLRQEIEKNLIAAKGRHESLIAKVAGLKASLETAQTKMQEMNSSEIQILEQTRLVDQARDAYRILEKKLEEARIQDELDQNVISDISPFQPASLVLEKVFPQRGLMLAVVAMGSLFVGLAFAVWRDQSDYRLAVNRSAGIPVVVGGRSGDLDRRNILDSNSGTIIQGSAQGSVAQGHSTRVATKTSGLAKESQPNEGGSV